MVLRMVPELMNRRRMQMPNTATVVHHSISRHYEIDVSDDIEVAKRQADEQFGDGFVDHTIVIHNARGKTIASRRIGDDDWNCED